QFMVPPGKQRPVSDKINEDMKISSKTEPTVKKMASLRQRIVYLCAATASIALLSGEALAQRQPVQPQAPRPPPETVATARPARPRPAGARAPAAVCRAPATGGRVRALTPSHPPTRGPPAAQPRLFLTDINPNVRGRYLLVRQRAGRSDQNFVDIENPIREQV